MAELMEDNTFDAEIFDYLIIPSDVYGDVVRFGIQTHVSKISTHPRFSRLFFRTRRPLEDFLDFAEFMRSRHPGVDVPPVPFHEADPDEDRELLRAKVVILREYMRNLLAIPEVFDDASIPMFLQSHTPMEEIREILAIQEAAAVSCLNRQRANDRNAQQEAAAANNDQQVAANGGNAQQEAAAANNDQQVAANGGNAQQEAAAANNDQQVAANGGNAQQEAANNDQQVGANDGNAQPAANNDQKVPANVGPAQAAIGNRDGNESSDGELAAGGNSGSDSDEPIFHMEDI